MELPRSCRTLTTPTIRGVNLTIGWECQRPFIAIDRAQEGETWEDRVLIKGGCRVFEGPGCEFECAGCYAYTGAYELEGTSYEDAASLGHTIGHSPRCPYPEGWANE